MDMRFGIWNVRSLYRTGSVKEIASELAKYDLDLRGCTGQMGQGW